MSHPEQQLLIIDDDASFRQAVVDYFSSPRRPILGVGTGGEGVAVCAERRVDVVLLDQNLPDGRGLEFCRSILQRREETKIIFITAYADLQDALQAVRAGAFDYLSKPVELAELEIAVERAFETLALERLANLQRQAQDREGAEAAVIASQGGLDAVRSLVENAAHSTANVLITGETGTGKSFLARAIHHLGSRHRSPFVSVNCAALPTSLAESEIFGHEKGAFTGAARVRRGVFEMADGGTLLLDEIGAMDLALQTKLLGVLEERRVRRVGGDHARPVDVRVIAATNAVLEGEGAAQLVRRDLYYRLNVIRIPLPPLRDRPQDIPVLCRHFLDQLVGPGGATPVEGECERLQAYRWPGNVRELRNILERAVAIQPLSGLRPSALLAASPDTATATVSEQTSMSEPLPTPSATDEIVPLRELERRHILDSYHRLDRNLARTARTLGISESTLRRKMRAYG